MPVISESRVLEVVSKFNPAPREGQWRVFQTILNRKKLNVKLPTGYGKTYTTFGCYSILKSAGRVNRLLVIVPTTAQLTQLVEDGPGVMTSTRITGSKEVCSIGYFQSEVVGMSRSARSQVFVTTVQALVSSKGQSVLRNLLGSEKWMIAVDEYHHYGINNPWSNVLVGLPQRMLLPLSATPYRKEDDSYFGPPDINVTYREAVEEGAVKPLNGHSYSYTVKARMGDGRIRQMTTDDIYNEFGTDEPGVIQREYVRRMMRWENDYIGPLVTIPLNRMIKERKRTGYNLQAIVGAICVSHAEVVCQQIRSKFPELRVDWVGTGPDGRTDERNKDIISRQFCPKKDANGIRHPTLDVLAHVGMLAEGMDSRDVSEVIHLNKAVRNNSNNQENGRAARWLEDVHGNINFDSSSQYAQEGYVGQAIMDAMDDDEPDPDKETIPGVKRQTNGVGRVYSFPAVEPDIDILNVRLNGIDHGELWMPLVKQCVREKVEQGEITVAEFIEQLDDPDHPMRSKVSDWLKELFLAKQAEGSLEGEQPEPEKGIQTRLDDLKSEIEKLQMQIVNTVETIRYGQGRSTDRAAIRISMNSEKARDVGPIRDTEESCQTHVDWLKDLKKIVDTGEIPPWLKSE